MRLVVQRCQCSRLVTHARDRRRQRDAARQVEQRRILRLAAGAAVAALVVGTGNKTESLIGYTTLFGDSACAFNPIGDLYKTVNRFNGAVATVTLNRPEARNAMSAALMREVIAPALAVASLANEAIVALLSALLSQSPIIIVTHDLELAKVAKRIIKIFDGQIISDTKK